MKNLARFIKNAREERKMSLRALASAAGMNASVLTRFDQGQPIRPATLRKLLTALGIAPNSPDYIEAFALLAADSSLDDGVKPVSHAAVSKKIGATGRARASAEEAIITAYRALSPDRQDTLDSLLKNPRLLDAFAELRKTPRTK